MKCFYGGRASSSGSQEIDKMEGYGVSLSKCFFTASVSRSISRRYVQI